MIFSCLGNRFKGRYLQFIYPDRSNRAFSHALGIVFNGDTPKHELANSSLRIDILTCKLKTRGGLTKAHLQNLCTVYNESLIRTFNVSRIAQSVARQTFTTNLIPILRSSVRSPHAPCLFHVFKSFQRLLPFVVLKSFIEYLNPH